MANGDNPRERLKAARLARNLSQAAAADIFGCSGSYVCKLEDLAPSTDESPRFPGRKIARRIEQFTTEAGFPVTVDDWDDIED